MEQGIGIKLSKRFYEQIVAPVLKEHFPGLPYAACRIGLGSEVLGYDTDVSSDHDYGPCVQIFLPVDAFPKTARNIIAVLDRAMPSSLEGWSTHYATVVRPSADAAEMGMLGAEHGVELYTLSTWCDRFLGRQFETEPSPIEWLSYPEHLFLMITAGAVFRDDLGELTALRQRLGYFPRDVWLYKLAAQWGRIAEERGYVGRSGDVGDELGSHVIAARMVGNIMRLAMLIERRFAPYPKWLGTAFASLACAEKLAPLLHEVLAAKNWQKREDALVFACQFIAKLQVERNIPGAIEPTETRLHSRPYRFVDSVSISDALRCAIADPKMRDLPGFGGADQFLANFVLAVPNWTRVAATALLNKADE